MRRICAMLLCVLAGLLSFPAALPAQQENRTPSLPAFEFHSGFWVNLHHFLYLQGRLRRGASQVSPPQPQDAYASAASSESLTAEEQRAWNASVAAYSTDWSSRDLLNNDLALINNRLAELED